MSTPSQHHQEPPVDLSKWRKLPGLMIGLGTFVIVAGLIASWKHDGGRLFGFAWLTGYMFCFSLVLGSLFLVLVHHLFDAGWSVPIRRFCEHTACLLFPTMAILWIPIGILAPKMYPWMGM